MSREHLCRHVVAWEHTRVCVSEGVGVCCMCVLRVYAGTRMSLNLCVSGSSQNTGQACAVTSMQRHGQKV